MMIAQQKEHDASLRFDYGDSILAPTREKVNRDGVQASVTWSSAAMSSEACKEDLDAAVLRILRSLEIERVMRSLEVLASLKE